MFQAQMLQTEQTGSSSGTLQDLYIYKMKRCSNKECCKQCRYVKFKGTMTKWPATHSRHKKDSRKTKKSTVVVS